MSESHLAQLYAALRLQLVYQPVSQLVEVTIQPTLRVNSARVRGGLAH